MVPVAKIYPNRFLITVTKDCFNFEIPPFSYLRCVHKTVFVLVF